MTLNYKTIISYSHDGFILTMHAPSTLLLFQ